MLKNIKKRISFRRDVTEWAGEKDSSPLEGSRESL